MSEGSFWDMKTYSVFGKEYDSENPAQEWSAIDILANFKQSFAFNMQLWDSCHVPHEYFLWSSLNAAYLKKSSLMKEQCKFRL